MQLRDQILLSFFNASQDYTAFQVKYVATQQFIEFTYCDQYFERIFNVLPHVAARRADSFIDKVFPQEQIKLLTAIKRAAETGETFSVDLKFLRSREDLTWVNIRGSADPKNTELVNLVARDVKHRKEREFEIQRAREILEQIDEVILVSEAESGKFTDANRAALKALQYEKQELVGKTVADIEVSAPIQSQDDWQRHVSDIIRMGNMPMLLRGVQKRKDGTTYPAEVSIKYYESDHRAYLISVTRDITEQVNAEKKIKESEDRLKALAHAAFEAIIIADDDICIDCNPAVTQIFGLQRGEVIGKDLGDLLGISEYQTTEDLLEACLERPIEILARKRDQSTFKVEIRTRPYSYNQRKVWAIAIRDISELRTTQEKLTRSRSLFQALFENAGDALFIVDINKFEIRECNSMAVSLFEFNSKDQLIGSSGRQLYKKPYEGTKLRKMLQELAATGKWKDEVEYVTKQGRVFWASLNMKYIKINQSEEYYYIRITDISQRKAAEEAIQKNEKLLNSINQNIKEGIYRSNSKGLIYCNQSFVEMFGYESREEMMAAEVPILYVNPQRRDDLIEVLKRQQFFTNEEIEFKRKDGSTFWGLLTSTLTTEGEELYWDGALQDITQIKATEDALRDLLKNEKKLNEELAQREEELAQGIEYQNQLLEKIQERERLLLSIIDNLPIGFQLIDTEGNVQRNNPMFLDMFKQNKRNIDFNRVNIFEEDWYQEHNILHVIRKSFAKQIVVDQEIEFRLQNDVQYFMLTGFPILADNNVSAVATLWHDVTSRKLIENKVKEISDRLTMATSVAEIGIWDCDIEYNHLFFEDKIYQRYGINRTEFDGTFKSFARYIHPSDVGPIIEQIVDSYKRRSDLEMTLRILNTATKQYQYVRVFAKIIYDTHGRAVRATGVALDITDLKNKENELLTKNDDLSKINKELDEFVYSASHQLRAPLTSIMGLINLSKYFDKSQELTDYLDMISKNIHKLDETIHEINDYSRNARLGLSLEKIDFAQLIQENYDHLKFLQQNQNVKFNLEVIQNDHFYSDRRRLKVVFDNIISNAIKYCDFNKPEQYLSIKVDVRKKTAHIRCEDNGIGIEQEHLDKVFNMFYRATEMSAGSGLGLYIVKEVVSKLKGIIKMDSRIGVGTVVRVIIPNLVMEIPEDKA